jgi:hypothetical protein
MRSLTLSTYSLQYKSNLIQRILHSIQLPLIYRQLDSEQLLKPMFFDTGGSNSGWVIAVRGEERKCLPVSLRSAHGDSSPTAVLACRLCGAARLSSALVSTNSPSWTIDPYLSSLWAKCFRNSQPINKYVKNDPVKMDTNGSRFCGTSPAG